MRSDLQKLQDVWELNRGAYDASLPKVSLDDLSNSIVSSGPYYYYVIDFYDMSISCVSPSIYDIHGFKNDCVTFYDIISTLHVDDLDFITQTEKAVADFFYNNIGAEKLLRYKVNYCFRAMLKSGKYAMFNHQAVMLTLDSSGKFGKSLNIHTRIDHLTNINSFRFSLIGLQGEPSFMNIEVAGNSIKIIYFSKREEEILKFVAKGLNSVEIGEKLYISEETVKQHRKNILAKADCKNTAELIKLSVLQGLI